MYSNFKHDVRIVTSNVAIVFNFLSIYSLSLILIKPKERDLTRGKYRATALSVGGAPAPVTMELWGPLTQRELGYCLTYSIRFS